MFGIWPQSRVPSIEVAFHSAIILPSAPRFPGHLSGWGCLNPLGPSAEHQRYSPHEQVGSGIWTGYLPIEMLALQLNLINYYYHLDFWTLEKW